jgi:hypothetical protein
MTIPDFSNDQQGAVVTDPETGIQSQDGVEVETTDATDPNSEDIAGSGEDLDVDLPEDDETETVTAAPAADATKATPAKATTPRQKAPEGYIKPVEFAKVLTAHLQEADPAAKVVPPQVVYSYIKNNQGEGARNPFPVHTVEGDDYPWYIVPAEGLAWWDAKIARVSNAKAEAAAKAAKKAAAPAATPNVPDAPAVPVVEAE